MAEKKRGRENVKGKEKVDIAVNTSVQEFHSYASIGEDDSDLHGSAASTPDAKKGKMDLSLLELQENLMRAMSRNTEQIMEQINKNTSAIDTINAQLTNLLKDTEETKDNVTALQHASTAQEKRILELEERLDAQERYHRRWNLRLCGLPEREGENLKRIITDICQAVAPETGDVLQLFVDICHRVGRKKDGVTRPVIIRFIARSTKEHIWRCAKTSDYLKTRKLHFKEDLTARDKEIRNSLWPQVEAARKEGKKAFFVGVRVVIDGKLI